jgi:hypothetical protein
MGRSMHNMIYFQDKSLHQTLKKNINFEDIPDQHPWSEID